MKKPKKSYSEKGYVSLARVWLGGNLARNPSAFTIYCHLIGWADFDDNNFRKGKVPIGVRNLGEQLGMSKTTIRKCLHWLQKENWIRLEVVKYGRKRGTLATIIGYELSQASETYKFYSATDQRMFLTPHSEGQKMTSEPGSEGQKMTPLYNIN